MINASQSPADFKTRTEIVADRLREAIISGELRPGDRLLQADLARQLNVSRMPVREALKQLAREGFVDYDAYKGAFVTELSAEAIEDLYRIRAAIEGMAARLGAERITEEQVESLESIFSEMCQAVAEGDLEALIELDAEFHSKVFEAYRREFWLGFLEELRTRSSKYTRLYIRWVGRTGDTLAWHEELIRACREHDGSLAEQLTRDSLQTAAAEIVHRLYPPDDHSD
jgi:DNA-binding GntR family transcriptional regulator